MQEPCPKQTYLTPFQQIEYYNSKLTWRTVYQIKIGPGGTTLWGMYIWLGGGVSHSVRGSSINPWRRNGKEKANVGAGD